MKVAILILIILSLGLLTNDKLDKKNGLGIYTFGTPSSSYQDLQLEFQEGNSILYTSTEDYINVVGVEFDYIRLTFLKNKLAAINIGTKKGGATKLFQFLTENFGTPAKVNKSFEWNGTKVHLLYGKTADGKEAVASLYSKELYKEIKK
jgi:hypothetical protein